MPPIDQAGASRGQGRERIPVWASFDAGQSWLIKRLIFGGPSAYCSLCAGRPGTPSQGLIYLFFEGGRDHRYSGVHSATFNLSWLLAGQRTGDGELPTWIGRKR